MRELDNEDMSEYIGEDMEEEYFEEDLIEKELMDEDSSQRQSSVVVMLSVISKSDMFLLYVLCLYV